MFPSSAKVCPPKFIEIGLPNLKNQRTWLVEVVAQNQAVAKAMADAALADAIE
jgi:hypothetical protein